MATRKVLSPSQVADIFGVNEKTITRWSDAGKLPTSHRTMGGHRRWYEDEIEVAIAQLRGE